VPVLLDGFVCTAAAAPLAQLARGALDHTMIAHASAEAGHRGLAEALGLAPLLDLGMRLGEASGAALAVQVLKAALAVDVGKALNPSMVEGQMTGGLLQGLATVLYEDMRFSEDGKLLNANFTDYKIPTAHDIPDEVVPIIVEATKKPKDAVEYAIGVLTKNCVWSVNEGLDPKRTQWSIDNSVENGDIKPEAKPTVERVANIALAREAVEKAGGRVTIGNCTI